MFALSSQMKSSQVPSSVDTRIIFHHRKRRSRTADSKAVSRLIVSLNTRCVASPCFFFQPQIIFWLWFTLFTLSLSFCHRIAVLRTRTRHASPPPSIGLTNFNYRTDRHFYETTWKQPQETRGCMEQAAAANLLLFLLLRLQWLVVSSTQNAVFATTWLSHDLIRLFSPLLFSSLSGKGLEPIINDHRLPVPFLFFFFHHFQR